MITFESIQSFDLVSWANDLLSAAQAGAIACWFLFFGVALAIVFLVWDAR